REDHRGAEDDPRPGAMQQPVVVPVLRERLVEAQPEREVVRERDQTRVHHELRQRMAAQRKGPRAKRAESSLELYGSDGGKQERPQQPRVTPHTLAGAAIA